MNIGGKFYSPLGSPTFESINKKLSKNKSNGSLISLQKHKKEERNIVACYKQQVMKKKEVKTGMTRVNSSLIKNKSLLAEPGAKKVFGKTQH